MRKLSNLLSLLLFPRKRRRAELDLDRELRYHLDRRVEDLKQSGLGEARARRQAMLEFGGVTQVREEVRDAWAGPRLVRSTGLILRDAVRAIRAAPAHSLFVVSVLAAGITLGTVTFSVVDAVILKPLPIERPEQVILIPTRDQDFQQRITPEMYWRLRDELTSVEALAARMTTTGVMVTVDGVTGQSSIAHASADIFRILRLSTAIGRLWSTEDEELGNTDVAVLGYRYWQDELDGDPAVLGKTVSDGRRSYTVIGVLSEASDHPELPDFIGVPVWVPTVVPRTPSNQVLGITARMRPGVSPAQVADDVRRIVGATDWQPEVTRLLDVYVSDTRNWLLLALGAAVLVVLVACANAANMMLTRSVARRQEMAVRASLGVSRRQIALGVVVEGLLLAFAATAAALLLSFAGVRIARVAIMSAIPWLFRASTISLDGRALAATIGCAMVTGVLFSLVPAWQTSRVSVSTLLKDSEAPTATGRRRWRSVFLTAEIATVAVLLVVSWLFVASFVQAIGIDLGIDRTNLLAVSPRLDFRATVDEVRQRIEAVPNVEDVAVSSGGASLPLIGAAFGGAWITTSLERVDPASPPGEGSSVEALRYRVTSNYFGVAGLDFRSGGPFPAGEAGAPVVVLDEQAARRLFGDEDPIGRNVRATRPEGVFTVVGTVPHVYAGGPEETVPPSAYFPLEPDPSRTYAALFVKTSEPPEAMLPVVTRALEGMGPDLEEPFVFAADDAVRRITASRRFLANLMSVFGLAGALIGAAGVYAVMASFVAQQTREIGIRMAFGATPGRVQRGVLGLAWRHLLTGLALGVPLAWWLSRGFAALLFQVTPADVSVYAGVAGLLSVVGCLAAWVPARRAAGVDPISSLRH